MAYAEKRGNKWRVRYMRPGGSTASQSGFDTKQAALHWGEEQEAGIRRHSWNDPRDGAALLADWVELWWSRQDLEATTEAKYRYLIDHHIVPAFGHRPVSPPSAMKTGLARRVIPAHLSKSADEGSIRAGHWLLLPARFSVHVTQPANNDPTTRLPSIRSPSLHRLRRASHRIEHRGCRETIRQPRAGAALRLRHAQRSSALAGRQRLPRADEARARLSHSS